MVWKVKFVPKVFDGLGSSSVTRSAFSRQYETVCNRSDDVYLVSRTARSFSKGGRYEVQSESGNRYEVDIIEDPDTVLTGSNAHPKESANICVESITKSNEAVFPDQTAGFQLS